MNSEDIAVKFAEHEQCIRNTEQRLERLEEQQKEIQELTISVKELAMSVKNMVMQQKEQGKRIEDLENAPLKEWATIKKTILTAVISTIGGALAVGLITLIASAI